MNPGRTAATPYPDTSTSHEEAGTARSPVLSVQRRTSDASPFERLHRADVSPGQSNLKGEKREDPFKPASAGAFRRTARTAIGPGYSPDVRQSHGTHGDSQAETSAGVGG